MPAINGDLTGIEEATAKLTRLKTAVGTRAVRKGLGVAAREQKRQAKARTPKQSGLLRKSLGEKIKTYRGSGTTVSIVGPRRKFGRVVKIGRGKNAEKVYRNPTRYAHIVEKRYHPLAKAERATRQHSIDAVTEAIDNAVKSA